MISSNISIWDSPNKGGIIMPPPPPPPARQNLIFQSTFETVTNWLGTIGGDGFHHIPVDIGTDWIAEQTCCGLNSLNGAPLARVGTKAAMFTEHKNDPLVSGSLRAELTGPDDNTFNKVRWYGFSIYLPPSFTSDNTALLVAQWHSNTFNTIPPMKIIIDDTEHWNIVNTSTGDGNNIGDDYHDLGVINKGSWTDFTLRILWNNTTAGQLQVWKNSISVFNDAAIRTSYTGGIYFKTGIYAYGWAAGQGSVNPAPYIVYIDEWRVGNENATYNDVAPGNY